MPQNVHRTAPKSKINLLPRENVQHWGINHSSYSIQGLLLFSASLVPHRMIYIAGNYAPELLEANPEEKGQMDQVYHHLKEAKSAITSPCYVGEDREKLTKLAKARMAPLVNYLGKKDYLFGSELRYLDFYFLEICD